MTSHPRSGGPVTYHVEISEVSLRDHLIHEIYHWYDMRIPLKLPGWKRFEGWLRKHGAEIRIGFGDAKPRWRDRPLGWPIEQDIKCYELGHGRRNTLLVKELTEQEYRKLGGSLHQKRLTKLPSF